MPLKKPRRKSAPQLNPYVRRRLTRLLPIFSKASVGDFSHDLRLPPGDDLFTELYAGVQIMLEVIREKIGDLERSNDELADKVKELKLLTAKIQTEQAQDEAMLMSIGDGLVVVDNHTRIVMVNTAFERLTGWTASEASGRQLTDILPAENERGHRIRKDRRPYARVLRTGKAVMTGVVPEPYYYVRKDGHRFPVAITLTPMRFNHRVVGLVNVFRDITHELEIDRAKSEFVSLASHELRTPLTIIRWSIDMLQKYTGPLTAGQQKYVGAIQQTGQQMVDLVDALLNVSRIELGTLMIEPVPTDLRALIGDIAHQLQPLFTARQHQLQQRLPADVPLVNCDPQLIRVAITNLLTNANKYTPPGGWIKIELIHRDGRAQVCVQDSGFGIPLAEQPKIFEKLFRAENVKSQEPRGTGLGLYIAKAVVEQSGGRLWFTSVEKKGSTFCFDLPVGGVPGRAGTKTITPS